MIMGVPVAEGLPVLYWDEEMYRWAPQLTGEKRGTFPTAATKRKPPQTVLGPEGTAIASGLIHLKH